MSTKLNVPLLIFALMIQCLFVGLLTILPASITSAMPSFENPLSYMAGVNSTSTNFGLSSISMTTTCAESYCDCSVGTLFLGCIGYALTLLWNFLLMLFTVLVMGFNVGIYLAVLIFKLFVFFIASILASFYLFATFPVWIQIPFSILLLAANLIIVMDIALVAKGLIENIM